TDFRVVHSFTATSAGTDGDHPVGGLVLSGNTLCGTAGYGGRGEVGTVFAVNTDGTGFTVLHSFAPLSNGTNNDGAYPYGDLILSGNTLYGPALRGGSGGNGTIFSVELPVALTIATSGANLI